MDREQWRPFLKRWSEEWIAAHEPGDDEPLDPGVVRAGWLGFAPAPAAAVAALEARLGLPLPPSLRGFLEATDGWRDAGGFVHRLGGAAEIGLLRDMDEMWISSYADAYDDGVDDDQAVGPLLRRAVQVSLEGDACVLFLDPDDVDDRGEWAAYELSSWSGMGPQRSASFYDLMYDLYAAFHAVRRPECETSRAWDARVEDARRAALAGEIDGPLAAFGEAGRFGRDRAALLAYQMRALLGVGGARRFTHLLTPAGEPAWIVADPVFEADLLPLMFAEQRSNYGASLTTIDFLMRHDGEPGPVQRAVEAYRTRLGEPGFRLRFGHDDFDGAVHAVLDGLSGVPAFDVLERFDARRRSVHAPAPPPFEEVEAATEEARRALDAAWPALRGAVRLWRPVGEHHVAPAVLLADDRLAMMITPERGRELLSLLRVEC